MSGWTWRSAAARWYGPASKSISTSRGSLIISAKGFLAIFRRSGSEGSCAHRASGTRHTQIASANRALAVWGQTQESRLIADAVPLHPIRRSLSFAPLNPLKVVIPPFDMFTSSSPSHSWGPEDDSQRELFIGRHAPKSTPGVLSDRLDGAATLNCCRYCFRTSSSLS